MRSPSLRISRAGVAVAILALVVAGAIAYYARGAATQTGESSHTEAEPSLPIEARATLRAIAARGPFRFPQDGGTFENRERRLPKRPRGYYREYTVVTPGSRDRGPRRIIAGGDPPRELYYTDDHYRTFRPISAHGSEATGRAQ
jgi:guanyl-specific ribonuclease Sa